MNPDNYVACGARLAQGDLVRAPAGLFVGASDLADASLLDHAGPPLAPGDPRGLAQTLPRLMIGTERVVVRAWYQPAVVVSPDCAIDKDPPQVLIAPVIPLATLPLSQQDGVRAGTYLTAIDLPADELLELLDGSRAPFPASYVDLQRIVPVSPRLLRDQRMVALSAEQIERLQAAWVRFVALRELSTTGTIAAAVGKRVTRVSVAESSKKRHTVILTFEDDSVAVLYQEPRRKGPHLQSVHLRDGVFSPSVLTALVGSDLVLRLENDDHRAWAVTTSDPVIGIHQLAPGTTTDVVIRCPDGAGEIVLRNRDRQEGSLRIQVIAPTGGETPATSG